VQKEPNQDQERIFLRCLVVARVLVNQMKLKSALLILAQLIVFGQTGSLFLALSPVEDLKCKNGETSQFYHNGVVNRVLESILWLLLAHRHIVRSIARGINGASGLAAV